MKRPLIALLGVFGAGNFGNEATLAAYLRFLRARHPDSRIVCICYNTELVEATYDIEAISIGSGPTRKSGEQLKASGLWRRVADRLAFSSPARWLRTFARIRKCAALVIPGTGILDDYGTPPGGLPFLLFRWCLAARLCRVPVNFIGVGAGPIVHPRSRRLMAWAARLARRRFYRDPYSKDFAQSIGVDTSLDTVIPDLAFLHANAGTVLTPNNGAMHIGLGLMTYLGWSCREDEGGLKFEAYINKMTLFSRWLLDRGYYLHLLIGELGDQRAVDTLLTSLRRDVSPESLARISSTRQTSMDDFLRQAETIDIAVVSRFHNLVGAFCRGKPAISIGYSAKNDCLMEDFGLKDFTQRIEELDLDRLFEQFTTLLARRDELSSIISARANAHRDFLGQQLSQLVEYR